MRNRFPYVGADLCKPILLTGISEHYETTDIWAGVSRDMPVYFPSVAGYSYSLLQMGARAEKAWVPGLATR